MRQLLFDANWKMHLGPEDARGYLKTFRARYNRRDDRDIWFFPPAVSVEAAALAVRERSDLLVGAQDIYWEPKGAFTGAVSASLALQAGARATLVGHSERRHVFGETDEDTRRKVAAALAAGLVPLLCVGETLAERDAGHTLAVVVRQLAGALSSLDGPTLTSRCGRSGPGATLRRTTPRPCIARSAPGSAGAGSPLPGSCTAAA